MTSFLAFKAAITVGVLSIFCIIGGIINKKVTKKSNNKILGIISGILSVVFLLFLLTLIK